MTLRRPVLFVVLTLSLAACSHRSNHGCVSVPKTVATDRLVDGGTRIAVPIGAVVYDTLVEPEGYAGSLGFPWLTPRSSNRAVLVQVTLCRGGPLSTLAVRVTGFRAVGRGTATLDAALAPRWRSITRKPEPSLDRVTVR
jgi:hypothetical protein